MERLVIQLLEIDRIFLYRGDPHPKVDVQIGRKAPVQEGNQAVKQPADVPGLRGRAVHEQGIIAAVHFCRIKDHLFILEIFLNIRNKQYARHRGLRERLFRMQIHGVYGNNTDKEMTFRKNDGTAGKLLPVGFCEAGA